MTFAPNILQGLSAVCGAWSASNEGMRYVKAAMGVCLILRESVAFRTIAEDGSNRGLQYALGYG